MIFWACVLALGWAFVGYPVVMVLRARLRRPEPVPGARVTTAAPAVTVVLAARNAESSIARRLENLLTQDYPREMLDVVVVCNGCTDRTEAIAREFEVRGRVRVVQSPEAEGKAGALNVGARAATGEVLVFADVRQRFAADAVRRLTRAIAEPGVGGVTGRLLVEDSEHPAVSGIGRYWQMETVLRLAESRTGSVVGATGAIYAIRRELFEPLPPGLILDDVHIPVTVARMGWRISMEPDAVAYDLPSSNTRSEYQRRVRTLVGNLELIRMLPWLLSPRRNPLFVRYISHKLLRVLSPAFVLGLLVSGAFAHGAPYRLTAVSLAGVYALGAIGLIAPLRVLSLPSAFVLMQTAGVAALLRPRRSTREVWKP